MGSIIKYNLAIEVYTRALNVKIFIKDPNFLVQLGFAYENRGEKGDNAKALKMFKNAGDKDMLYRFWVRSGVKIWGKAKKVVGPKKSKLLQNARKCFKNADAMQKKESGFYFCAGYVAYILWKEFGVDECKGEAINNFTQMLKLYPDCDYADSVQECLKELQPDNGLKVKK